MADATYDPNAWYGAFRNAIAPMIRIQEDGLKTAQRFARLQRTITGDCIDSGLAQLHAALESRSPAEFFEKERDLAEKFGDRTRSWTEEFMTIANGLREAGGDLARDSFSRAADSFRTPGKEEPRTKSKPESPGKAAEQAT